MDVISLDPVTAALLTTRRPDPTAPSTATAWREVPLLSFITTDRPPPLAECDCAARLLGSPAPHLSDCALRGPSPWIGQRVALHARDETPMRLNAEGHAVIGDHGVWSYVIGASMFDLHPDAIVGSGTLADALPILGADPAHDPLEPHVCLYRNELRVYPGTVEADFGDDISDQLPLQDWTPGRWALRFTDVAPTSDRCPRCEGHGCLATNDEEHPEGRWSQAQRPPVGEPGAVWVIDCSTCRNTKVCPPVLAPVLSGDDPTYKEWRPT